MWYVQQTENIYVHLYALIDIETPVLTNASESISRESQVAGTEVTTIGVCTHCSVITHVSAHCTLINI